MLIVATVRICTDYLACHNSFVESGVNICEPDAAVLHDEFGVLHDDDISTANSYEEGGAGYGDNLDCGVRIRGRKGSTVNLHVVQMSLEGDGYGA